MDPPQNHMELQPDSLTLSATYAIYPSVSMIVKLLIVLYRSPASLITGAQFHTYF